MLLLVLFSGIPAFASVALPGPGQTLVCDSTVAPAGEFPSSPMHIKNIGDGTYTITEDNHQVAMSVTKTSDSQVVMGGKKRDGFDFTLSFVAYASLNADGSGTAWIGLGGWNPAETP